MFQSSSSPKAGCNECRRCIIGAAYGFQSSSSPKAGCNVADTPLGDQIYGFQSSSSPKAGCNSAPSSSTTSRPTCFNPHPARRPDATPSPRPRPTGGRVSILIQPEGRMQPLFAHGDRIHVSCFNPHPARRPDATLPSQASPAGLYSFQSSSSPKAGCNMRCTTASPASLMFQSSSSPKAGCNEADEKGNARAEFGFNPHPARRPDATAWNSSPYELTFVSILIQPEGRMQRL